MWRGSQVLQHVMAWPHLVFWGSHWPQLHSVYAISSQQPGLACSPSNFGVGPSRASISVMGHVLVFLGFQGGAQACLCFESRFLGCPPGLRPFRFWLELCIPCLALGSLMIFARVSASWWTLSGEPLFLHFAFRLLTIKHTHKKG
jgi:hypothetical protein